MEVKSILLCDAATSHPDGTFSLLRGGIDRWGLAALPAPIQFSFIVTLELMSTEVGQQHIAELDIIDEDGNRITPQAKIPFSIPVKVNVRRYKFNLVVANALHIKKFGWYSLQVGIDGRNLTSLEFQVEQAAPQTRPTK